MSLSLFCSRSQAHKGDKWLGKDRNHHRTFLHVRRETTTPDQMAGIWQRSQPSTLHISFEPCFYDTPKCFVLYLQDPEKYEITTSQINDKTIVSFLKIMSLTHTDNGTYLCHGENDYGIDVAILENLVLDKPEVLIDMVVPVGKDKIFLNWTVTDWNLPISDYFLSVSTKQCSATLFQFIHSVLFFSIAKVARQLGCISLTKRSPKTPAVSSCGISLPTRATLSNWQLRTSWAWASSIFTARMCKL